MTPDQRLQRKNEFDGNLVFGSRIFNIATGRDVHLKKRDKFREKACWVDPGTGILPQSLSRSRVCPVCGIDQAVELFCKDGFRHVRCGVCGMVYVNPTLREDRLHSYYQDEDSYRIILLNEQQLEMDRRKFHYGLDLVEAYVPSRGRLLDIGCGPGVFLDVARQRGWEAEGVEFNHWCVEHIRGMGFCVHDRPLEEANITEGLYNCITLWTVLEHMADPGTMLRQVRRLLSSQGLLLILVPNIESLATRILHEKSVTFAGDSHVNFFNVRTLTRLLSDTGFTVREAETVLTELGTINNHLNFENPYFGEGQTVLDFLTPTYIHEHMLGYLLLVLASLA